MHRKAVHPTLERGASVIVGRRTFRLEACPHRAVENEHPIAQRINEWRSILA
jgi:hypothetical protein